MPNLINRDFSGGWKPSVDESNAPPNVLLRADNLELQEQGVLSLRRGHEVLTTNTTSAVEDVAEFELGGAPVKLTKTGVAVYAGTTGLGVTAPAGSIAFGAVDGHALISAGTLHKKYDGTTVRNWGVEAPLEAPNVYNVALASKTVADFSQASAEFTAAEGTRTYVTGQDAVANAATGLQPAAGTGRGEMSYTFASAQDLLNFSGGEGGQFDTFEFWFDNGDPVKFLDMEIVFGISDSSVDPFELDGYYYQFGSGLPRIGLTTDEVEQAKSEAIAEAEDPVPTKPNIVPRDYSEQQGRFEQRTEETRKERRTI